MDGSCMRAKVLLCELRKSENETWPAAECTGVTSHLRRGAMAMEMVLSDLVQILWARATIF